MKFIKKIAFVCSVLLLNTYNIQFNNSFNIQRKMALNNEHVQKSIEKIDASFVRIGDECFIQYNNKKLQFRKFNYYKFNDGNGYNINIQADVAYDMSIDNIFAYINIKNKSSISPNYSLTVRFCEVNQPNVLKESYIIIGEQDYYYFFNIAEDESKLTDDIKDRLRVSYNTFKNYDYNYNAMISKYSNDESDDSYSDYTSTDGIIHDYMSDYIYHMTDTDGLTIDDPIVRIVPKSLFFSPCKKIIIGSEYGFFIYTYYSSEGRGYYESDVLVFDIENVKASFDSYPEGYCKITPLFQHRYISFNKEEIIGILPPAFTKSKLSQIVQANTNGQNPEYFMKDIGVRFSVFNTTYYNFGDDDYNSQTDYGAFFILSRSESYGVGLKSKGNNYAKDLFEFAFGIVDFSGAIGATFNITRKIIDSAKYVSGTVNGLNQDYLYGRKIYDQNNADFLLLQTNNTDQINEYGQLIKSVATSVISDDDSPKLINVGGGSVKCGYGLSRSSKSNNNDFAIITSISLKIVEDNTPRNWNGTWSSKGKIDVIDEDVGSYISDDYSFGNNVLISDYYSCYIPPKHQNFVFEFKPKYTGKYYFKTYSYGDDPDFTMDDPNFTIYDASTRRSYVAHDNFSDEQLDAYLELDLDCDHRYYLKAYSNQIAKGYDIKIVFAPMSDNLIDENDTINVEAKNDEFKMIKFTPKYSSYYDVFAKSTNGDLILSIFDSQGNRIANDDDSLDGSNPLCEKIYFSKNETYFIALYDFYTNNFNAKLSIIPSLSTTNNVYLNVEQNIELRKKYTVFQYNSKFDGMFDLHMDITKGNLMNYKIYDSKYNLLCENNKSVNMKNGEKYYIIFEIAENSLTQLKCEIRFNCNATFNPAISLCGSVNNVNISEYNFKVFKLVANESRYYNIYTSNLIKGDPVLYLLDENGKLLEINDDNPDDEEDINSYLNFYATKGETYYIVGLGSVINSVNIYDIIIS